MLSNDARNKKRLRKKKSSTLSEKTQENSAEINYFKNYYDDSSDEETVTERNDHYNIHTALQKKLNDEGKISENEFLSFVVHSAGLQLLYSDKVNQIYYPLKSKQLKSIEDGIQQLQTLIQTAILQTLHNACQAVKNFVFIADQKDKNLYHPNKLSELINIKSCDAVTNLIDEYLIDFVHSVKASRSALTPQFKSGQAFCSAIITVLCNALTGYCKSYIESDGTNIQDDLKQLCRIKINDVIKKLKINSQNSAGKMQALIRLDSYQGDYTNMARALKKRLQHCYAVGSVHNMIMKAFDKDLDWQNDMMFYLQEDIAAQIKNKQKFSAAETAILQRYFILNRSNVITTFKAYLESTLERNITTALKFLYRPTLGKSHLFYSQNAYAFYANLRLSNRSQKRQSLNMKYGIFNADSVVRTWVFSPQHDQQASAVELQQITGKNFSRKDLVADLGSYEKINTILKQIFDYYAANHDFVADKKVALWIRDIFYGKEPKLSDNAIDQFLLFNKLQSLTYLLFGCEAARNPSMIIVNQMLLDLIIADPKYTFDSLFSEQAHDSEVKAPMAAPGAVAVARALESHYRAYMPHPYIYGGNEDDNDKPDRYTKTDLINAEAAVVKTWLQMKLGKRIISALDHRDAKEVLKYIEASYSQWFCKSETIPLPCARKS